MRFQAVLYCLICLLGLRQKHFKIWRNKSYNLHKYLIRYILQFLRSLRWGSRQCSDLPAFAGSALLAWPQTNTSWRNMFYNLGKYILQFDEIHLTFWARSLSLRWGSRQHLQAVVCLLGLSPRPKPQEEAVAAVPHQSAQCQQNPRAGLGPEANFFKKLWPIEPNANNRIFLRKMDISPALMATTSTHHKKGYIFWKKWRNLGGFKPFSVVQTQDQDLDQKPKKWTLFETCGEKWNTIPFKHSLTLSRVGGGRSAPPVTYLRIHDCIYTYTHQFFLTIPHFEWGGGCNTFGPTKTHHFARKI